MGRLSDMMRGLLMRRAAVVACEDVAERFRLITLEGPALRAVDWIPGQKVQIAMAAPFVTRTYTPIEWDVAAGRAKLLCFMGGGGPGSIWVRDASTGDEVDIFGPRASLDTRSLTGNSLAIFGDETSVGLAYALARGNATRSCACHFETDHAESVDRLRAMFGLSGALLFPKEERGMQLFDARLEELCTRGASFVLSGRADTVQRLRQALKRRGVPSSQIVAKAYWATGKVGLD